MRTAFELKNDFNIKQLGAFMAKLTTLAKAAPWVAFMLLLAGCSGRPLSTHEKGTLAGGALRAGTAAIVGSAVGDPGSEAAIDGALGAGTGLAVGNAMQNQEGQQAKPDRRSQISSERSNSNGKT